MVRKKQSRAPSRARPKKLDITIDCIDDEEKQENLKKRLEDFDQQVLTIVQQMEDDKEAILASIRELYFRDEQYTATDINEMGWLDYLKRNIPVPRVHQSINTLITIAESQPATVKRKRQKQIAFSIIPSTETPLVVTEAKTKGRPKRNVLKSSQTDNIFLAPPQSTRSSSRVKKIDPMTTPMNAGSKLLPSHCNFVTPKFDTRTPLHAMTFLRTPRVGEIAMSLRGSPLQVGPKEILASLMDENLDTKTKQELVDFHEKLGKLLL